MAMLRAVRPPKRSRDRLSRPRSSVPRRWARDGPRNMLTTSMASGLWGASRGAKIATAKMPATTSRLSSPTGRRTSSRSREARASRRRRRAPAARSAVTTALILRRDLHPFFHPNAGIEEPVGQVRDQVAQDEEEGIQQDRPPDDRPVAVRDGLQG